MSQRNGDKARFGKEHKKKLLRRERNLALRQSLESTRPGTTDVRVQEPVTSDKLVATPHENDGG